MTRSCFIVQKTSSLMVISNVVVCFWLFLKMGPVLCLGTAWKSCFTACVLAAKQCILSNSTHISFTLPSSFGGFGATSFVSKSRQTTINTNTCSWPSANLENINFFFSQNGITSPLASVTTHIHTHFIVLSLLFVYTVSRTYTTCSPLTLIIFNKV